MMADEQQRKNPFGDIGDLSDFAPRPAKTEKPAGEPDLVRQVAEAHNFTSRAPAKAKVAAPAKVARRWRTGRNVQLSLKVTEETAERFAALADKHRVVYGELLERALAAFEAAEKGRG